MTRTEIKDTFHENKYSIAAIGLAILAWAASMIFDDLRGKVDPVAITAGVGGLLRMMTKGQASNVESAVITFGSGLEELRRDFNAKHAENQTFIQQQVNHDARLTALEEGQKEVVGKLDKVIETVQAIEKQPKPQ